MTIKGLGLDRAGLREERLIVIREIRFRYSVYVRTSAYPDNTELKAIADASLKYIMDTMRPDAEYSSMAIDFVSGLAL